MATCNICKYAGRPTYKSPCSECKEFSKYEYENKKTNADIIRSMTDDELNELFNDIYNAGKKDASAYEWGQRKNSFEWTMDWLQMPTETQKEDR